MVDIEEQLGMDFADGIFKLIDWLIVKPRRELELLTKQNSIMIENQNEFLKLLGKYNGGK